MTALPGTTMKKLGLVIDLDTCVGCQACATSCKEWNTGGYSAPLSDIDPYGADPHGAWLNRVHSYEVGEGAAGNAEVTRKRRAGEPQAGHQVLAQDVARVWRRLGEVVEILEHIASEVTPAGAGRSGHQSRESCRGRAAIRAAPPQSWRSVAGSAGAAVASLDLAGRFA